jgi:hypothetical protein
MTAAWTPGEVTIRRASDGDGNAVAEYLGLLEERSGYFRFGSGVVQPRTAI